MHTVRVWDLPTRLFHWLLATSVIAMVVTAKLGGNWMVWHLRLGHVVLALLVFRLLWGFVGGRWSRFSSFIYHPASLRDYLRGQAPLSHRVGHSPLGALSVFALLAVLLVQVGTGLVSDDEIAFFGALTRLVSSDVVSAATHFHKAWGQWLVIGLVVTHLLAIAVYQWIKKQALVGPMWHGDKTLPSPLPGSADGAAQRGLALALALAAAAISYGVARLGQA